MIFKCLTLACLLFSFTCLSAQQKLVDSLRQAFVVEKSPEKKIDIFYEIANELSLDNPKMGFAYADSLEIMSKKAGYKKGLAMSKHLRGFAHDDSGEYEKALHLFREELAIFIEIEDKDEISTAYTNLGSVWGNMGRNDSSVHYYLKSLTIDMETGDSLGASIVHNNIGNIYSDDGAYDKAIEHFEKALAIRKAMKAEKRYMQCYHNIATVYSRMKDYKKSEEYALLGVEVALKYDNKAYTGILYNGIGANYNDQKRHKEAIVWLEKALATWREINNEAYTTYALYNLSMAYAGLKDGQRALQAAQEGYAIVQKLGLNFQNELYFKAFAQAHEANGDLSQAYGWYKKYVSLADSIFKQDNTKKVAQMEAQFESQQKEAKIAHQHLELERQSSQKRTILISAIAALLAAGGGFQYFRNKQRLRQKVAEMAAQLEHAEAEKLRDLNAVKSTFFANISHEFRTPLTLIVSPLEQMMNGSFQGDFQKYYRIMHRNGKRLLDLVNQLLDLSRLESGKLKLAVSEGDLSKFVSALAFSFESLADRQHVDLQVVVPTEPLVCYFDSDKLEKILSNLISNAFKFTSEDGRVELRLTIHDLRLPANGVVNVIRQASIVIQDTGIGIAAEQLPQIFERFSKTTTSEVQPGSGIGLALTKELVELHGGKIEVKSTEGTGSTFTVTLPVDKAFFKPDEIVPASEQTSVAKPSTQTPLSKADTATRAPAIKDVLSASSKPVLLIAEDNADVRSYIADQFRGTYQILEAENGKLALQKALESTPDLIISDIMMPEMDGTEFCKLLKINEKTSHIPIVMLTALAEQHDRLKGLETGADDYLVKPFDARELQVRVANLIAGRQKLQEHYRKTLNAFASKEVKAESLDAQFLNKVREAVEANLDDENFSVVELGGQVGMSRSQLHRKLSALTGFSPNEVIRNMRLERAKQLLEQKAGNASEIAYMTGFNSPAYFAKCFKDYFGVTPSEV